MPDPHVNFLFSTVQAGSAVIGSTSGTGLDVGSGANRGARFPDPASVGAYNIDVWPAGVQQVPENVEIMRVTAKTGSVLTVTRAQEGTSARSDIAAGDQVAMPWSAKSAADIEILLPVIKRVGTQQDITTAGFVDITNLNFPVKNGRVYYFKAFVPFRTSATTMGVLVAWNGPAMTNTVILSEKTITTPGTASTDMLSSAILTAVDTPLPNSTSEIVASPTDLLYRIEGTLVPSADGTFALRVSKENVAGTASIMPSGVLMAWDTT